MNYLIFSLFNYSAQYTEHILTIAVTQKSRSSREERRQSQTFYPHNLSQSTPPHNFTHLVPLLWKYIQTRICTLLLHVVHFDPPWCRSLQTKHTHYIISLPSSHPIDGITLSGRLSHPMHHISYQHSPSMGHHDVSMRLTYPFINSPGPSILPHFIHSTLLFLRN